MKKLLFSLLAVFIAISGWAQIVTIGNGTIGNNDIPIANTYNYSYTQQIFTASEIGMQIGVINSISFQYIYGTPQTKDPIIIYLGNTSKSVFTNTTDWVPTSFMTEVFNGSVIFSNSEYDNWVNIPLDIPFQWDGTSNIVVSVLNNNGSCYTNPSNAFYTHGISDKKTLRYRIGNMTPIDPVSVNYSGQFINYRNNIQFEFGASPTCLKTSVLTFNNILPNSLNVLWEEKGTATQWDIEYKLNSESNWNNAISNTVFDTITTLTNLRATSLYDIRVRSYCGVSEQSLWRMSSFRTGCGELSEFPWIENFDAYGGTGQDFYPACWGKKTTYNNYPMLHLTHNSSPASLYFYTGSGKYNIAILPAIHSLVPINTLSLNFNLHKNNVDYNITIGVMTDTANVNSFDSITTVTPSVINNWEGFNIDFSNYLGLGKYIAFRVAGSNGSNAMRLDDLVVYKTLSCSIPSGLISIDSLATPNSITLNWDGSDDNNVSGWIIDYKPIDANLWQSEIANNHPFTLTGLQSSIIYQFRISAICSSGGDTTFTSNSINVEMQCAAITSYPWIEGFEGDWHSASGVSNIEHPWCWTNINGGDIIRNWKKTTSEAYIRSGKGALQMNAGNTNSALSNWFITPTLTLTGNQRLKFWAKGYSNYIDDLNIQILDVTTHGVVDTVSDTSLFTVIMPNTIIPVSDWTEYEISLSQFFGDYQIAFVRNTTGGYNLNIDDISVSSQPQCARPSVITFNNILYHSIDVSWLSGNSTDFAWYIYYKETGNSIWDSVYTTINPFSITNLIPNTEYEFQVRTDCGSNLLSHPSLLTKSKTLCQPIDGLTELPWNEGFEGITAKDELPACWSSTGLGRMTNTQIIDGPDYRIARTGTKSAWFGASANNSFTSPIFELYGGNNYIFSLWYITIGSSCWDHFQVRVKSVNDNSVDQVIGSPILNPINTVYQKYTGDFIPSITGLYEFSIEIKTASSGVPRQAHLTFDDVKLEISNCPMPQNVIFNNITATSIDMIWDTDINNQWIVQYKASNDLNWISNIAIINSYSFTNLIPQTDYDIRVATLCGVDTSVFVTQRINTLCTPISNLPYSENFDTYGGDGANFYPDCWTKITTYSAYPYLNSINYTAPYSLYFNAPTGDYNLAILHEIDQSIQMNTLMVSFWMRKGSVTSNLIVGIMDSIDNPATFTPIDTVSPSATLIWEKFDIYLNSYTGSGRHIAFKSEGNFTTNYFYLDDVIIDNMPTCPKPIQLSVSNINTSSVDISWVSGGQVTNAWWLYYKESSLTSFDSVYISNLTTYTLLNLNHSTEYDYYLRTDCNTEISEPTKIENFFTQCNAITLFPWSEGFENNWVDGVGVSNDNVPDQCWVNISGENSLYKWRKSTSTTIPTYVRTGTGAAQLYGGNNAMGDYLMTPIMRLTGNEQFVFWGKGYSNTSRYPENLWVKAYDVSRNGGISSYSDTTLLINLAFINDTNCYTWNEYKIPLTNLFGDYRLVFARDNNVGYYYQLDDLMVDIIPACPRPISASVSNITQNTASISWTPGTSSDVAWKVYFRTNAIQVWDSVITTNKSYTLTGLSPSTEYEVGIATDCGTGEFSNMKIITFRTLCGPITFIPWIDNFDSYGTGSSVFPDCWTRNTTQASRPYVNATSFSSPGSLYFYAGTAGTYNIAATPQFDSTISISSLKATFKYRNTNATDILLVGAMTDPNVDSTLVIIDTITAPTTSAWYNYNIDFSSYTGTGQYIAFRIDYTTTTCNGYIDNLEISYNLVCNDPTSLIANNITTTSADITWNAGGTETSWQIKQGESGNLIDLINNTYQATGLSLNTNYTFYVRSNCGNNIYSSWVPVTFTTLNLPVNPVVETSNITVFTHNTARFTGSYTQGLDTIIEVGFNYKEQTASIWINEPISQITTPFNFDAINLTPNASYQVIAYAITKSGRFYGDTATFTTNQLLPPNVTTDTVIVDNTDKSAKFEGTTSQGTYAIIARGFEYKISSADWSTAIDLTATGSANIIATATSLKVDKYNVRAYAETGEGKTYGDVLGFEIVSGLNDINVSNLEVNLYPNPASNEATLSIKGVNGKANIVITDVQGRTINKFDKEGILGEIKHSLDLSNYAKGVYYIRIQNSSSIKTQKLIVQ